MAPRTDAGTLADVAFAATVSVLSPPVIHIGVMLLTFPLWGCISFTTDDVRVDTTKTTINSIETGLRLYRSRHEGTNPSQQHGLQTLVNEHFLDKTPKDGFNNNFVYVVEGNEYSIISYGKDGAAGGDGIDADINSRNMDNKAARH